MKWIITLILIFLVKGDCSNRHFRITIANKEIKEKAITNQIKPIAIRFTYGDLTELAKFIKSHEGLILTEYICPGGYRTIGYGHSLRSNEKYNTITQQQADSLLYRDIKNAVNFVNANYDSLSFSKKIALTHFVYAVGCGNLIKSKLHKKVKNNEDITEELLKWSNVKGKFSKELYKQRKWELSKFYEETTNN